LEQVDARTKGFWLPGGPVPVAEFAAARHPLFGGPFSWPVLVLKRDALAHNAATMAAFCAGHGLALAPHGKTSMAPALFRSQLAAGAWGITLATANQLLVARDAGVSRLFLANELLDSRALRWLVAEREADPAFEFYSYVDSAAGVEALRGAVTGAGRDFTVVVELGYPGGRTGVRTVAEAGELARLAASVPGIAVAGVAGYEGGLSTVDEAAAYLRSLREAAAAVAPVVPADRPVLVSAGGSAYFDTVAAELPGPLPDGRAVWPLLRSGAYLTHDDGFYREKTPFRRLGNGWLEPALEVWAQVTSVPEPGLVLVGMGKRDAPFDEGLPVPKLVRRAGATGDPEPLDGVTLTKLNDQHAYLSAPAGMALAPGDLIGFGISHPCTAFDKWRVIPVVDAGYRVTDLVPTYF
jgi:D-serine deaminase-like pyridoxal phosphate-dependent protein